MINNQKILAIIPARGGSKSIPKKNIRLLAGKPLIAYAIEEAKKSKYIDRIVAMTDDNEIADIAKKYGAEVPFMEPKELAKEEEDIIYLRYAIEKLEEDKNYKPEFIVFLRPTSPLRRVEHINAGIEKIISTGADCIKSVCKVPCHPHKMWKINGDKLIPFQKTKLWIKRGTDVPRQILSEVYFSNSGIDIFRRKNLYKFNYLFGEGLDIRTIVMDAKDSVDIDEPIDLFIAEAILKEKEENLKNG